MIAGTSGSSGERSSASTLRTLIRLSVIHSGREILMLDQNWDYLYERAQWFPAVRMTMQQEIDGVTQTRDFTFRGRDRLVTMVLGNLKYPSGKLIFPGYVYRRDVSWTAARNTPKQLTAQTHVAPFHHHTDCAPGAPFGSPFV